ncbi:hypothetical protein NIES2119_06195 [[Phormidium ambiguum] IAM M-71]|uniref:Uncharacterized protein n=1 Tax=[Phormidium ambiguum] IAM M-71 TaxID=454136 RepID=A0A1U7IPP5_9CYAN|nr:hypothetical protein [Phormidium ambiguum]OKH39328.1 hypothetical protein NIES2119_06195 [Phormidium ambiguum IAM M-71]
MPLKATDPNAKTLILLALWDIGAAQQEVNKGLLTKRIVPKGGKIGDFQEILEQLQAEDLMQVSAKKIFLPAKGMEYLNARLNDPNFLFKNQIGAQTGNSLLKWMREMGTLNSGASSAVASTQSAAGAIPSYDEFKQVVLEVYDKLNRDYNLDNLVPIYRIRREIGDRVSRSQFNDWMLEMQANDILQLQGGSVEDSAPDKIEDSIRNSLGNLRCYAKRMTS